MKAFIVLALVALASADVSHLARKPAGVSSGLDRDAQILAQQQDVNVENFQASFDTSNGISRQDSGQLKNAGREDEAFEIQGSSQYNSPEGIPIQISYTADENGYHPVGDHLPTPPPTQPIPEAIARALSYIAAHPPPPEGPLGQQTRRF